MSATNSQGSVHTELLDVIIVGAGPCGLATAARLREQHPSALFTDEEQSRYSWISRNANKSAIKNKRSGHVQAASQHRAPDRGPSMLVLDSCSDHWMAKWTSLFRTFEISHLRSPMFFHPDPSDRDALLAFVHERDRMHELEEIPGCVGKEISKHKRKKRASRRQSGPVPVVEVDERDRKDYFTPSAACFYDFCESCVERYDLRDRIVRQETVEDVDYDYFPGVDRDNKVFRVDTSHERRFARVVVLALGGGQPVIPAPFPPVLPEAASHAMLLEAGRLLSSNLRRRIGAGEHTSVLVIGGGLTSAQLVDGLIRKGVGQVHLVMRGPLKVKPFDVDLSWMSKFRNQQRAAFWSADSFDERLQQAKDARNGGSITPRFSKRLKKHMQNGRLQVHTHTMISSQQYCRQAASWSITTDPPTPHLPRFDHVYFATGTWIDAAEITSLRTMRQKYPIQTFGGLPVLTDDLQWTKGVPLFVTGKLATLQIGPGAANLEGARLSAERIAWAIDGVLERGGERPTEPSDEHQKDCYWAGVGSRYAQLSEA